MTILYQIVAKNISPLFTHPVKADFVQKQENMNLPSWGKNDPAGS